MSEIKSKKQLYLYCTKNKYTIDWGLKLADKLFKKMQIWLKNSSPIGRNGYYLEKIARDNYLNLIDDLGFLLEDKCSETVTFDTVYYAANRIFRDIAKELESVLSVPSYYVVLCANEHRETVFFVGPREVLPQDMLFSEKGIFMTLGYDVLVDFIDRANNSSESELFGYLKSKGFI